MHFNNLRIKSLWNEMNEGFLEIFFKKIIISCVLKTFILSTFISRNFYICNLFLATIAQQYSWGWKKVVFALTEQIAKMRGKEKLKWENKTGLQLVKIAGYSCIASLAMYGVFWSCVCGGLIAYTCIHWMNRPCMVHRMQLSHQ